VPPFLVRSPFRTDEALRAFDLPVLLLHGRHDRLVPLSDARRLAALAPRARVLEYDGGHNDSPEGPDLFRFREALAALLAQFL
jgi:pimeloyl-ACP methyl ester carboxylesterase